MLFVPLSPFLNLRNPCIAGPGTLDPQPPERSRPVLTLFFPGLRSAEPGTCARSSDSASRGRRGRLAERPKGLDKRTKMSPTALLGYEVTEPHTP